jgi:hypothetical protein
MLTEWLFCHKMVVLCIQVSHLLILEAFLKITGNLGSLSIFNPYKYKLGYKESSFSTSY